MQRRQIMLDGELGVCIAAECSDCGYAAGWWNFHFYKICPLYKFADMATLISSSLPHIEQTVDGF
jgi:hypothetical protein